jgi:glycosyltransferase involved in cell wall biosynthesis
VSAVHHFVPVLHRGDAVGRHTLRLRAATRARGVESNIYVDTYESEGESETADESLPVMDYLGVARPGDVLVYQFATASPMALWLASRPETLVVNYHNITPPDLMAPWDHQLALGQLQAQHELRLLAPRATLAVADSDYNETFLRDAGFAYTAVIPPSAALNPSIPPTPASRTSEHRPRRAPPETGAHWLAVGRVAPNKALQHVIAALAVTRAHHDPDATLMIVGKPATVSYDRALQRYAAELGLTNAVSFTGHVSDAIVAEAYETADVLVVTSEHEGFCVPVVEAMAAGLPVVAFDRGAVPEVLNGGGALVASKDPYSLAASVRDVLGDAAGRKTMGEAASHQLEELDIVTAADRFAALLVTLLDRSSSDLLRRSRSSRIPRVSRETR